MDNLPRFVDFLGGLVEKVAISTGGAMTVAGR